MIGYRVTKYNPDSRNEKGWFMEDDWTSYYDVGETINNRLLTLEEYIEIENQYISVVVNLMKQLGEGYLNFNQGSLGALEDENFTREMCDICNIINVKQKVNLDEITDLIRLILRNYIWGVLKGQNMEVHFGNDYYMYIGMCDFDDTLMNQITPKGMYFERWILPTYADESL